MNIVIIQDNGINESLVLTELVSFVEKQGHRCQLFLVDEEPYLDRRIRAAQPDLFLVPSDIGAHHWTREIAAWLKKKYPLPVVCGGNYPTFYPNSILSDRNIDYIIAGEAENAFGTLLRNLECNLDTTAIPGIWCCRENTISNNGLGEPVADLDTIPLPRRNIYYKYPFIKKLNLKRFITGRGCYNNCTFCFNPVLRRQYPDSVSFVRQKSVNRVIEEILSVSHEAPFDRIHFSDDIFVTESGWMSEFAELYPSEIGIPFSCNISLNHLTRQNIDLLDRAGCRSVAIGVETGSETLRRDILGKNFTNREAMEKSRYLRKKGISVTTFNMFGLPGETTEDRINTFRLNYAMRSSHARITCLFPLPETGLMKLAVETGVFGSKNNITIDDLPDYHHTRWHSEILCSSGDYSNLLDIFPVAFSYPALLPLVRYLARKRYFPFLKCLSLFLLLREKSALGINWISGIRYYRHTGSPRRKTKNFHTLI